MTAPLIAALHAALELPAHWVIPETDPRFAWYEAQWAQGDAAIAKAATQARFPPTSPYEAQRRSEGHVLIDGGEWMRMKRPTLHQARRKR